MAMMKIEEVLAELEGEGEYGERSLATKGDLEHVRRLIPGYAFAYSRREGGRTVCSGCGEELDRRGEKHGDLMTCPNCRKVLELREEWRGHKYLYDQRIIYIWKRSEKDPKTVLAKAIHAEKHYGNPSPENTPLQTRVTALYQFGPKGAKMYRRMYGGGFAANAGSVTPEENKHGCNCGAEHVGFQSATSRTLLGDIADALDARTESLYTYPAGLHPILAMTEAARKPYLLHVIRSGQSALAQDIARGNYRPVKRKARTMPELLGLTEGQWYEVRKNGIELNGGILKALTCMQLSGNMTCTIEEAKSAAASRSWYSLARLADNAPRQLSRCTPKLRRKAVHRVAFSKDMPEWLDYWEQLERLGEDMTDARILLPKNMHTMHQRMTERIRVLELEEKVRTDERTQAEFEKRLAGLKAKYTFEACGLILRPFESAKEVVQEGARQHICIGGYAHRYVKGDTILCALRRVEAPEEPWRAVEFSAVNGKLVQDRGAYNDRGPIGSRNLENGVEGWLKRFWTAFEANREAQTKKRVRESA